MGVWAGAVVHVAASRPPLPSPPPGLETGFSTAATIQTAGHRAGKSFPRLSSSQRPRERASWRSEDRQTAVLCLGSELQNRKNPRGVFSSKRVFCVLREMRFGSEMEKSFAFCLSEVRNSELWTRPKSSCTKLLPVHQTNVLLRQPVD